VDDSGNPDQPDWRLSSGSAPTLYGATDPAEDLAEALSLVAIGRDNWVDDVRLKWIAEWLDSPVAELTLGLPWVPPDAEEVVSTSAVYDEQLASSVANRQGVSHIEPAYFLLPEEGTDFSTIAEQIEVELRARRFEGTFGRVTGDIPRYQGTFTRPDGEVILVELWGPGSITDQQDRTGRTLLTYVLIW
jgi:hypothetical protein